MPSTDQCLFAGVPAGQQVGGRRGPEQSRMGDAGEANPGDVPRGGEDALVKIPDGLVGIGKVIGEETSAIRAAEDPGVAPGRSGRTQDRIGDGKQKEWKEDTKILSHPQASEQTGQCPNAG